MINRAIIIVLDSFGMGELPDANVYHDEGSNTLKGIYERTNLKLPNLKNMGLYNIEGIGINDKAPYTIRSIWKSCRKIKRKKQSSRTLGNVRICYRSTF